MEGRHLEVTINSAEDLKKVNLIGKMHTYAIVWVDPYYRQSTGVDKDGGAKPKWNHRLSFPVPEPFFQQPQSRLTIEIYSQGTFTDDKLVGTAHVPLSDFSHKDTSKAEEVLTLPVMKKSGKPKGSIRLSVRLGEKTTIGPPAAASTAAPPPMAAYPEASKQEYAGGAAPAVPYAPGVPVGAPAPYGYPPAPAPYQQPYGYYQPGAPPPQYYAQQPPSRRPGFGGGGAGLGLGAGLLAGAVGGLIVGDMVDDAFDGGCDF